MGNPEREIIFQTQGMKCFMEMSNWMKIIFEELRTNEFWKGSFGNKNFDKGNFFHTNGEIDFFDSTDIQEETVRIIRVTKNGIERSQEFFQSLGIFSEDWLIHFQEIALRAFTA